MLKQLRNTSARRWTRCSVTAAGKAASAARPKANRARGKARAYERVRARAIKPNTRVMTARRCHDRRMFLSLNGDPTTGHTPEQMANSCGYTVAHAVKKYGVSFHGGVQMGRWATVNKRSELQDQVGASVAGVQHRWLGPLWNGGDLVMVQRLKVLRVLWSDASSALTAGFASFPR